MICYCRRRDNKGLKINSHVSKILEASREHQAPSERPASETASEHRRPLSTVTTPNQCPFCNAHRNPPSISLHSSPPLKEGTNASHKTSAAAAGSSTPHPLERSDQIPDHLIISVETSSRIARSRRIPVRSARRLVVGDPPRAEAPKGRVGISDLLWTFRELDCGWNRVCFQARYKVHFPRARAVFTAGTV